MAAKTACGFAIIRSGDRAERQIHFQKCILFVDLSISQIVFYAIIDNPEKTCYNYLCWCAESTLSGCGAVGSVLPWGGRGRPFKSGHSDQNQHAVSKIFRNCVFCFVWGNTREICNKILEQHQLTKRRLYTILKCTAFFCISSMRAACFVHCYPYSISPIRSFTTSPAMISPTTDGTKALLPGTCRRWVHLRAVPGGQMQWVLQLFAMSSFGAMGFSLE